MINQSTGNTASKWLTADHGLQLDNDLSITKCNQIHFTIALRYVLMMNNIGIESNILYLEKSGLYLFYQDAVE